jgi:5-methylphenazine-1-carboxylate 1-monooxygenase
VTEGTEIAVIGGGIGGLTLALALHEVGIACRVYEAAPEIRALGVGINLLPHATRELGRLGLLDRLLQVGVETRELCFYTRHGQLVYREPRGRFADYQWPQISIHRGDLQTVLLEAAIERLGKDAVVLGHKCIGVDQNAGHMLVRFADPEERALPAAVCSAVIGCDGIHSTVRRQIHPHDTTLRHHPTTLFRGVTRWPPFLSGASMTYVGTNATGKLVLYPIRNDIDDAGRQLLNWVIEVACHNDGVRDWNRATTANAVVRFVADWTFEWLDVPAMIAAADTILEYPVVDQDPLPFWSTGRVTLLGDAAHPMLPRGSNGSAQAILDAATLSTLLAETADPNAAFKAYEAKRLRATAEVTLANRDRSPDAILRVVEERTGGKPFKNIGDVISEAELRVWQEAYKGIAGFRRNEVKQDSP